MEQSLFLGSKSPAQEPSGCELARRNRARQPCFCWLRWRRTLTRVHPPTRGCASVHFTVQGTAARHVPPSIARACVQGGQSWTQQGACAPRAGRRETSLPPASHRRDASLARPPPPLPRQEPACSLDAGLRQPPRSRTQPPYSRIIVQPSYSRTQRSHSRTQPSCSRTQPSCSSTQPSYSSTIPHTLEPYFSKYYTVRLELSFFVCFFNVLFLKKYY